MMEGDTLVGTLRSWRDPWGFIVCPAAFEGDLFAHRENFIGGAPPGELAGASVQFRRNIDGKGRPHASDILVLQLAYNQNIPNGNPVPVTSAPSFVRRSDPIVPTPQVQVVPTSSRASAEKLSSLVGSRLRGKIRSWKDDWGFLTSAKFEGDLFVHRQNLRFEGEPLSGKPVSFSVAIDSKNRATAMEVTEPTPAPEDFEGNGPLTGQIRSWKNDWGFIVAPEHFEGDLFCHQEHLQLEAPPSSPAELAQVVVNRAVSFEVMSDAKGRAHATKVTLLDAMMSMPMPVAPMPKPEGMQRTGGSWSRPTGMPGPSGVGVSVPVDNGEVLTGVLRSWRDPWGFIVCPQKFEGDLFVHKEAFLGEQPTVASTGRSVQFLRALDNRGRQHAAQVQLLGPSPAPMPTIAPMQPQGLLLVPNEMQQQWQPEVNMKPEFDLSPDAESAPRQSISKFDHVMGQQVTGSVRSWKGDWGFLVSPEHFEGDLFAHKMNLQNGAEFLAPNAQVIFEVGADSRGRATALNVRCSMEVKDWAGSGVQLQGTIRSFREPWGFLVSPGSYNSDLFFHVEHVAPGVRAFLRSGLEVTFRVENDSKGRCTAMDIQIASPTTMSAAKRRPMEAFPALPFMPNKRPKL